MSTGKSKPAMPRAISNSLEAVEGPLRRSMPGSTRSI